MIRLSLKIVLPFVFCLSSLVVQSQTVYHPIQNHGVYTYLDELAASDIIELNSVIKPYSRLFISNSLSIADSLREQLSSRQQKELDFYLRDFGKELNEDRDWDRRRDLFYYKDDLFTITANPIFGGEFSFNNKGNSPYWRNGAGAWSYIGKWSFWVSLRDNHEEILFGKPEYLTKRAGGHIKNGTDWSEMRGGISYAWEWGSVGVVKEGNEWGSNYNGANILGGHNPSFLQLRLNLKPTTWFEFNYIHGWLNSMVVDSTHSFWVTNSYGTDYREIYHGKFIAANMSSFRPLKGLWVSVGNSIIYDNAGFQPHYLFPLFFYKSIDHQYTSGVDNMNSQMFMDISSRQIRNLHLYGTMFIDELSVSRIFEKDELNFISYKAGGKLFNISPLDFSFTAEYTCTFPMVFQHYVPTLSFETNQFNMGHYLKDNSREWYLAIEYRPSRTGLVKLWFSDAVRGPDYTAIGGERIGNPLLETIEWRNTSYGLAASYQLINDIYISASITQSDISGNEDWTAAFFYGKKTIFSIGATAGF